MARDPRRIRIHGLNFVTFVAASTLLVLSAACDGCKEKPAKPDTGQTTAPVEKDTGPDEPVDPLKEARENAEEVAESDAVHLSDIARSVGAEIEAQANKPDPKPRPKIKKKKEPEDTGRLAKAQLDKVFNAHADAMKKCYERSLKKMPGLQGKVRVQLRIASDGSVSDVNVRAISLADPTVHECMQRQAMTMQFPEPDGGSVRVGKTYAFFPEL